MMIFFFVFNDTATTEIYTLSLHDALPISRRSRARTSPLAGWPPVRRSTIRRWSRCCSSASRGGRTPRWRSGRVSSCAPQDRKSTRLNSSHANISYAVFCLKKKKIPNHSKLFTLLLPLTHLFLFHSLFLVLPITFILYTNTPSFSHLLFALVLP